MMKKFFSLEKRPLAYLFLFLTTGAYFLWLGNQPFFPDPDAFYHAKMAMLINENGLKINFDWLPLTVLQDHYADHQLLYHLLIAPILAWLGPLWGIKIATVFFGTLTIVCFQLTLDKFRIRYSFVYTLILLFANQFVFRINLAKTSGLSLCFLLTFFYFYSREKKGSKAALFVLSWAYVWLYGGWPIIPGIVFIFSLIRLAKKMIAKKTGTAREMGERKATLGKTVAVLGGLTGGLIINPYFPENLKFYWWQTIQIAFINYKEKIEVGGEWYPINMVEIISQNVFICAVLLLALIFFVINIKKQEEKQWAALILTLIFFGATLRARRHIEYFAPFALLFAALSAEKIGRGRKNITALWQESWRRNTAASLTVLILTGLTIPMVVATNIFGLKEKFSSGYTFAYFSGQAQWLKKNTRPEEIIFHDRWDDFPSLFYHNSYNRYIIGLDPSFLFFQNEDKYFLWRELTSGERKKDVCAVIKKQFGSSYLFIKTGNNQMRLNVERDENCQLVYRDKDGYIYQINQLSTDDRQLTTTDSEKKDEPPIDQAN